MTPRMGTNPVCSAPEPRPTGTPLPEELPVILRDKGMRCPVLVLKLPPEVMGATGAHILLAEDWDLPPSPPGGG